MGPDLPTPTNLGNLLGQSAVGSFQSGVMGGMNFGLDSAFKKHQMALDNQFKMAQQAQEQQYKSQENSILQKALTEAQQIYANPDLSPEQKTFGIYQTLNKNPSVANQLLGHLKAPQKAALSAQNAGDLYKSLIERNVDPQTAKSISDRYKIAPEGGKTAIMKGLQDLESRGLLGPVNQDMTNQPGDQIIQPGQQVAKNQFPQLPDDGLQNNQDQTIPPVPRQADASPSEKFRWPKIQPEKKLTPKEEVSREDKREKANEPYYTGAIERLSAIEKDGLAIDNLIDLNEGDKLPQGIGRINVNPKTGELLIPAAASAEAQLFAKTVNDFTTRAKESFGSRISNFELDRFMQRLPTLANSKEGRELILKQMKTISKLGALDQESIIKAYDNYGVKNINYQDANRTAKLYKAEQKSSFEKEYRNIIKESESLESNLKKNRSKKSSGAEKGFVRMRNANKPEDPPYDIPIENANEAIADGWIKL